MYIVGELNDAEMAQKILNEYDAREIKGHYYKSTEHQSFVIAVENAEHLEIALDIYRVKLGLKKPVEIDPEWLKIKSVPRGELTKSIVIFCVIIYLMSFVSFGTGLYQLFQIDVSENGFLLAVTRGQIWRLITPIFLHMSFFHILFNMLWLNDLGSIFEFKYGKKNFIGFILVSGFFSNLLQYYFSGPNFGGMSGVIYGLLSFLWIAKKMELNFEFSLPKHDVTLMIIWFFLCLFGIFPKVANFAHAGGIAVGIWWAALTPTDSNTGKKLKLTSERLKYISYGVAVLIITFVVEKYKIHF